MELWWEAMTGLERVMACIACPATLVLLIQTVLLFFGFGGADGGLDIDVDGDGIPDAGFDAEGDADGGMRIFTVRGLVTFFTIFGWSALVLLKGGTASYLAVGVAFILGVFAMVLTALFLKWVMKLQSDGTVDIRNAVGLSGRVYLPVPARRAGTGKVNVLLQERYCECSAVSDSEEPLPTDCEVVVTGISGRDTLIVRRKQA